MHEDERIGSCDNPATPGRIIDATTITLQDCGNANAATGTASGKGRPPGTPNAASADEGEGSGAGIVYRRTDANGGKPNIGQAKSEERYLTRQGEHSRANPDADFEFEVLGRATPGEQLDRLEEFFIRQGGGPTNVGNPNGLLANLRHQMSGSRYWDAGGDF